MCDVHCYVALPLEMEYDCFVSYSLALFVIDLMELQYMVQNSCLCARILCVYYQAILTDFDFERFQRTMCWSQSH